MKYSQKQVDLLVQSADQTIRSDKQKISNYAEFYNSRMSDIIAKIVQEDNQLLTTLKESRIVFNQSLFNKQFEAKVKKSTINKEVIVFNLKWGYFQMEACVLHVEGISKIHKCQILASHLSSDIYKIIRNNSPAVIKCIKNFTNKSKMYLLSEWFLTKIGSVLGFGPKLLNLFGFDITIYEDCSEFSMQECCNQSASQQTIMVENLSYKLALMHRFKIVHQDIKPQNIMFSEKSNSYLFIDFGLSKIIEEKIGYKTMSYFVGSTSFCSPDMLNCFHTKTKTSIDLYYNDLFSLAESIKNTVSKHNFYQDNRDEQDYVAPFKLYKAVDLDWIYLFQAKFILFTQQISKIHSLWPKIVKAQNVTGVLVFLKQLTPSSQLKNFFSQFISDTEAQTITYRQIQSVYKNSSQHAFCPIFAVDSKKLADFQSFYEQDQAIILGVIVNSKKNKEWVRILVNNRQQIKKIQYLPYVKAYLQFISYLNNIHRVDASQREKAALIYIQTILKKEDRLQLMVEPQPRLVNYTIRHILRMVLSKKAKTAVEIVQKSIILMQIYDFLVVLGLGFNKLFLVWIELIFQPIEYIPTLRSIFIKKVQWSISLIRKRVIKVGQNKSVVQLIEGIVAWKKKICFSHIELNQESIKMVKQIQLAIQRILEKNEQGFDFEWYFDEQLNKFIKNERIQNVRMAQTLQSIEQCYLRLINKKQFKNCYFFLIDLYQQYFSQLNHQSCKSIYNIMKQNFNDQLLLQEFTIHFEVNTVYKITVFKNYQEYRETLSKMNQYYMQLQGKDLLINSRPIYLAFNIILIYKVQTTAKNATFVDKQSEFIIRFAEETINFVNLTIKKHESNCINIWMALEGLKMINRIESSLGQAFVQQLQLSAPKIRCFQCKNIILFAIELFRLNVALIQLSQAVIKHKSNSSQGLFHQYQEMAEIFYSYYLNINKQLDSTQLLTFKHRIRFINQYYSLLLCCNHNALQQRYHGIYNFYKFASGGKTMEMYLLPQMQFRKYVQKTFEVLEKQSQQQFFMFLFQISAAAKQKPFQHYSHPLYCFYFQYMLHRTQEDKISAFYNLRKVTRQHNQNNAYVSIFFNILLNLVSDFAVKRQIECTMIKLIDSSLILSIKVLILVNIYYFVWKSLGDKTIKHQRKRVFCSKKIVKYMMNGWGGQKLKKKPKKLACQKRQTILSKLSNFQRFKLSGTADSFCYSFS